MAHTVSAEVSDELWTELSTRKAEKGLNISFLIRSLLTKYVEDTAQ